tara:strand:+ start:223 stop:1014 length:792 start_codon:yes stop_codon:yes gene_type:complete
MKRFFSIFLIFVFIVSVSIFYSKNRNKIQEPIFIGHVYGDHNYSDVPYKPLKKVINKYNLDFIIFGGDITKNHNDFYNFNNYFSNINKLYIKGNHDTNIYEKTEFWKKKKFKNLSLINLSNQKISDIYDINFNKYENTFFISHYNWFEKVFYPLKPSNQSLGIKNNLKFDKINNFGKGNKFISGDCGKYKDKSPYVLARYNNNYFLCTGLGQSSNNFIILSTLEPIFFNKYGDIVRHKCKENKFNDRYLKVCSTKKNHLFNLN